jgi:hypothetical protein
VKEGRKERKGVKEGMNEGSEESEGRKEGRQGVKRAPPLILLSTHHQKWVLPQRAFPTQSFR